VGQNEGTGVWMGVDAAVFVQLHVKPKGLKHTATMQKKQQQKKQKTKKKHQHSFVY
jgi:hypothetical protein